MDTTTRTEVAMANIRWCIRWSNSHAGVGNGAIPRPGLADGICRPCYFGARIPVGTPITSLWQAQVYSVGKMGEKPEALAKISVIYLHWYRRDTYYLADEWLWAY